MTEGVNDCALKNAKIEGAVVMGVREKGLGRREKGRWRGKKKKGGKTERTGDGTTRDRVCM